jgi:conjugative relaxase-like TrwC/TraI family protein
MLTAKNTGASQAIDYFTQGCQEIHQVRWWGEGAASLGLGGTIEDVGLFGNICNGYSPDGRSQICRERKWAAIDFTFSAPKSVSLSALIGDDKDLRIAHRRAVEKALSVMELNYAQTRIRNNGDRYIVNTANLVVAQFRHIESRELDPHLHTHCLVMNMTQIPNGSWYSLHNGQMYRNKKSLGMIYQNHLAREVQKIGYQIKPRNHGQFEIKDYKRKDLVELSKRMKQITTRIGASPSWQEREDAWDITRKSKQIVPPQELKQMWRQKAEVLGIEIVKPKAVVEIKPRVENTRIRRGVRM